jgi:hypothetical protein
MSQYARVIEERLGAFVAMQVCSTNAYAADPQDGLAGSGLGFRTVPEMELMG